MTNTIQNPCPVCKGKCCRDSYGYKLTHMGDEFYEHTCEACEDGTKYIPPRTAKDERAAVLAYLDFRIEMSYYNDAIKEMVSIRGVIERGEHLTRPFPDEPHDDATEEAPLHGSQEQGHE